MASTSHAFTVCGVTCGSYEVNVGDSAYICKGHSSGPWCVLYILVYTDRAHAFIYSAKLVSI